MVLLNGNKYACETCIKGHRSSNCIHTDRPLFEIKKKGRPVTQCDHCRKLRQEKQVHVKCICEPKVHVETPGLKKGHTKIPNSAAFPVGLSREALGASVAAPPEGPLPESNNGGPNPSPCRRTGGVCNCCSTRKNAPKHKKTSPLHASDTNGVPTTYAPRTPSHILARLAELRPVLPRPSSRNRSNSGASHDPSVSIPHGHPERRRSHENLHFSPYGRPHDVTHESFDKPDNHTNLNTTSQNNISIAPAPVFPTDEQTFRDQLRALEAATAASGVPPSGTDLTFASFPSVCGCGDNCSCPGCVQHNPGLGPAPSAYSSCINPGGCNTCLDCTLLSLPASLPPDTALSIYDGYQAQSIDEWIRQVSSLPRASPGIPTPSDVNGSGLDSNPQDDRQWDSYLPPIVEPPPPDPTFPGYKIQLCCGVLCKCSPEGCECDIDDESGYDCRREMLIPTFDNSTDRSGSPSHAMTPEEILSFGLSNHNLGGNGYSDTTRENTNGGLLSVDGGGGPPRSRSSSTSSSKSHSSRGRPQQPAVYNTQPISSDFYLGQQTLNRGRHGIPFYTTGPSSISSPNLGLRLHTEINSGGGVGVGGGGRNGVGGNSFSASSSPGSISPARSVPNHHHHHSVTYAGSNPDSDGYLSAEDGIYRGGA